MSTLPASVANLGCNSRPSSHLPDPAQQRDRADISPEGAAAAAEFADRMKRDLDEPGTLKLAAVLSPEVEKLGTAEDGAFVPMCLSDAERARLAERVAARNAEPHGLQFAAVKVSDVALIATALGQHLGYLTSCPVTARFARREIIQIETIIGCHAREFAAFVVHRMFKSGDIGTLVTTDRIAICVRAWHDARARRGIHTARLLGDGERMLLKEREQEYTGLGGEHAIEPREPDTNDE